MRLVLLASLMFSLMGPGAWAEGGDECILKLTRADVAQLAFTKLQKRRDETQKAWEKASRRLERHERRILTAIFYRNKLREAREEARRADEARLAVLSESGRSLAPMVEALRNLYLGQPVRLEAVSGRVYVGVLEEIAANSVNGSYHVHLVQPALYNESGRDEQYSVALLDLKLKSIQALMLIHEQALN